MANLNSEIVNQFIIDVRIVIPIQKIVSDLEGGNFRDCDIKWLENKLCYFIEFAGKTLGINLPAQLETKNYNILNECVKDVYLGKFKTLLEYFKQF